MPRQFFEATRTSGLRGRLAVAGILVSVFSAFSSALAQGYPTKPITIVVPSPPGGILDSTARHAGDILTKRLGQAVVIDNKSGGSGNLAYGYVAHANPDGYTLLASNSGFHLINPTLNSKLPWAQKDFIPIALIGTAPNLILVNSAVPAKNLGELITYLKANPGKFSYASQGNGTISHIGTELFKQRIGASIVHIPYKGGGPALIDVLSNQVQMFIATPVAVQGYVKNGRLRALAVASKTRFRGFPDIPTTAEAGLPGMELDTWVVLCAPAGTPKEVVDRISQQLQQAYSLEETRQSAEAAGFEVRYESPQLLAQRIDTETKFWAQVIKKAKIQAD